MKCFVSCAARGQWMTLIASDWTPRYAVFSVWCCEWHWLPLISPQGMRGLASGGKSMTSIASNWTETHEVLCLLCCPRPVDDIDYLRLDPKVCSAWCFGGMSMTSIASDRTSRYAVLGVRSGPRQVDDTDCLWSDPRYAVLDVRICPNSNPHPIQSELIDVIV